MFCTNCGTQLPDDAEFCSNCGQKVEPAAGSAPADAASKAEAVINQVGSVAEAAASKAGAAAGAAVAKTGNFFQNKFLPGVKKNLKWIILGAVVILAIAAFFITGSVVSSPGNVVKGYLNNLASGNYAAAFERLNVEESEFINSDLFAQYIAEEGEDYSEYQNCQVMPYNDYVRQQASQYGLGSFTSAFLEEESVDGSTLSYVAVSPDDSSILRFTLIKQDSNFLLFWPTYKISTENILADVTIYTLPDSTVAIDGISVAAAAADEDTPEGCVPYTVPSLLRGDHTLTITNPLAEDYENTISVYSGYTRTINYLTYSEDVVQSRYEASQALLSTLINGAIANTAFDDLGIAVTSDSSALEEIREAYDDLLSDLHDDDGTGLKSITFTSFEDSSYYDTMDTDLTYDSRVRFRYDYVAVVEDYSTGQLVDRDSTYTHSSTFSVEYTYENGNWVLSELNTLYLSY